MAFEGTDDVHGRAGLGVGDGIVDDIFQEGLEDVVGLSYSIP
jgi:hypothetical protein